MTPLDCADCAAEWQPDELGRCAKCGATEPVPRYPPPRLFPEVKGARPRGAPRSEPRYKRKQTPGEPTARVR